MANRRRVLLVDSMRDDQDWLAASLTARFKYLVVKTVATREEAHQELLDNQYDVIVTDMLITPDPPGQFVCELLEIAMNTPIIVLTSTASVGDYMLDVISLGVRHILYKEDVRQDIGKLQAVIVDVIHDAARRDAMRDTLSERVTAIARKVGTVDGRIFKIETSIGAIADSIKAMALVVEKRGGLEDRIHDLEQFKGHLTRVGVWVATGLGAAVTAIVGGIFTLLKH